MKTISCPYCLYKVSFVNSYQKGQTIECTNCKSTYKLFETKPQPHFDVNNEYVKENDSKGTKLPDESRSNHGINDKTLNLSNNSKHIKIAIAVLLSIPVIYYIISNHYANVRMSGNSSTNIAPGNVVVSPRVQKNDLTSIDNHAAELPDDIGAYIISENFVKDNIVSPSTADFPLEPTNVKHAGNKYIVCSYIEAQNSYGVKLREKYICYMVYKGGRWSTESNWTLMSLEVGDDVSYINKDKTEQDIANDINYLRSH